MEHDQTCDVEDTYTGGVVGVVEDDAEGVVLLLLRGEEEGFQRHMRHEEEESVFRRHRHGEESVVLGLHMRHGEESVFQHHRHGEQWMLGLLHRSHGEEEQSVFHIRQCTGEGWDTAGLHCVYLALPCSAVLGREGIQMAWWQGVLVFAYSGPASVGVGVCYPRI